MSLRSTDNMPRFSAFLMTCKQARISCVDLCLGIFCASFFTLETKRKYPRTRTSSALDSFIHSLNFSTDFRDKTSPSLLHLLTIKCCIATVFSLIFISNHKAVNQEVRRFENTERLIQDKIGKGS